MLKTYSGGKYNPSRITLGSLFCWVKGMAGQRQTYYIYFDGVCHLCTGWVQWLIRRDRYDRFRFIPLQSPAGREFLLRQSINPADLHTIYLSFEQQVYARSSAVLHIAGGLPGLWPVLRVLFLVPGFLRDAIYRYVAKNRYRWWGKYDQCMVPDEKVKRKFIMIHQIDEL